MADPIYLEIDYAYGHGDPLKVRGLNRGDNTVVAIGTRTTRVWLDQKQALKVYQALGEFLMDNNQEK